MLEYYVLITIVAVSAFVVAMVLARRLRAIEIAMKVFAFADGTSGKELLVTRIHALDAVGAVATEIDLHPDVTVAAVEVEIAFLFTTDAFASAVHTLIVTVTFRMNSVMAVALRFRILAAYHRSRRRRWRWRRRSDSGGFLLLGFNVDRQCHSGSTKQHERHREGKHKLVHMTSFYFKCYNIDNI